MHYKVNFLLQDAEINSRTEMHMSKVDRHELRAAMNQVTGGKNHTS